MFGDLGFFLSEAINGMRRSGLMIFISIATISVSLIVFGMFLVLSLNLNHLGSFVASKLEIRVYLNEDLTRREIKTFGERLGRMNGVKNVQFVDKEDAWKNFKESYPSMSLADLLGESPLPDAYRVVLSDNSRISMLASYIAEFKDIVEDVQYGGVIAERITLFSKLTRIGGIVLVGLLTFATLLIVVNTIRLTVIARQTEIEIMQLVGATNQFIRWPFIFEGIIIGLVGSVVSVLLIQPSYGYLVRRIQEDIPFFPLVYDWQVQLNIYSSILGLGILLGVMGAFISVSRSLKTTL